MRQIWRAGGLWLFLQTAVVVGQDPPPLVDRCSRFEHLTAMLKRDGVSHDVNADSRYVVVDVQKGPLDSAQVIRWAAEDGVVHFVQIVPIDVPEERLAAVESAILRLNHAYPIPGLGINHESDRALYFRMTVPLLPRGYLTEEEVQDYFSYVVTQAVLLSPVVRAVAEGKVPPEQALEFHNRHIEASARPFGTWKRDTDGVIWLLEIATDGTVQLRRGDQLLLRSQASLAGGRLRFEDTGGPFSAETPGIYEFFLDEDRLYLELVDDVGERRRQALTAGPWSR